MSAVLQLPMLNTAPFMVKEKAVEPFAPAFTAVNGRSSSSTSPGETSIPHIGMPSHQTPAQHYGHGPLQNGHSEDMNSSSSPESDNLSDSPRQNRRSNSLEDARPAERSAASLMPPQARTLPPLDSREHDRRYTTEPPLTHSYPDMRDARLTEPVESTIAPMAMSGSAGEVDDAGEGILTEVTRAGVQVELKKRKRQFANRTKTGCGTCRRRKKKCDEAKPECNNCSRGGFVCEGYASKIPWPKNGVTKPPPPLQAKEQMRSETPSTYNRCPTCYQYHLPHCAARSTSLTYPDPRASNGIEGPRSRPTDADEPERKPPAPSTWGSTWGEQQQQQQAPQAPISRPHPPEQHVPPPPPQYPSQPPASSTYERLPSHEHHLPHPLPTARPHQPRVYHHTPQSMSQTVPNPNSTPGPSEATPAPPSQHSSRPSMPAAPTGPPTHFAPPTMAHKTEKEKMLKGEPFRPYDEELSSDREHCRGAVNTFNTIFNPSVLVTRPERERVFKTILGAPWIKPRPLSEQCAHLGPNVHVSSPFHCDYGYNLSIAENVVIGSNCQLIDSALIAIGRNTKIGARVVITTIKTPTDPQALKGSKGTEVAKPVWIGENVYIGDGCIIEAGVRIGENVIVRAGSVVVRDLPPGCVAYGNPALG